MLARNLGVRRPSVAQGVLAGLLLADCAKHAVLLAWGPLQPWPDSDLYWRLGQDAAAGDVWLLKSQLAFRTPIYPWLLACCQLLAGAWALWLIVLLQHVLELAVSWLTAATVQRVTQSAAAGIAAYAGCVLLTARPLFANWLLTETCSTFLTTLLCWLLVRRIYDPARVRWLVWSAVALGLGILLRPAAVAFVPALLWVAWISKPNDAKRLLRLKQAAAALGICAAVVLPWCVRNAIVWNRFTVTVFLGRELWAATFSDWPGAYLDLPTTGAGARLRAALPDVPVNLHHNWSVAPALSRQGLDDVAVDELMQAAAVQAIRAHPVRAGLHVAARCLTFWYVKDWELVDFPAQTRWSDQAGWSSEANREWLQAWLRRTPERFFQPMWAWTAATWLGVLCLVLQPPRRSTGVMLALLLFGLTLLTALLEIPCYRYRCVIEPVMLVAGVSGLATLPWRHKSAAA